MTEEQIQEHFLSLENHRNAIKVLIARLDAESFVMPDDDKAKEQLVACVNAFKSTYADLDSGVDTLALAKAEKAKG